MRAVSKLIERWRKRGDRFRYGRDRHTSAWESETTGTDLLGYMVKQKQRAIPPRKEPLP